MEVAANAGRSLGRLGSVGFVMGLGGEEEGAADVGLGRQKVMGAQGQAGGGAPCCSAALGTPHLGRSFFRDRLENRTLFHSQPETPLEIRLIRWKERPAKNGDLSPFITPAGIWASRHRRHSAFSTCGGAPIGPVASGFDAVDGVERRLELPLLPSKMLHGVHAGRDWLTGRDPPSKSQDTKPEESRRNGARKDFLSHFPPLSPSRQFPPS